MPTVGEPAPHFELPDQAGAVHNLADLKGSWVVLFFYPKDDTPGCTIEACQFRDALPRFEGVNAKVFGISADDEVSHQRFAEKFSLNYPLLVDGDLSVLKAYDAYGEKTTFGKKHMGVFRRSYLIDPEGRLARAWPNVTPDGHAEEVRNAIEELSAA